MTEFRVTKYDPALRRPDGAFPLELWTSVSDIGTYDVDGLVTEERYRAIEDQYVAVVDRFLSAAAIRTLRVTDLHMKAGIDVLKGRLRAEALSRLDSFVEGALITGVEVEWAVRLNLRDCIWCRLQGEHGAFIHFGYDYYMYFGAENIDANFSSGIPTIFAEVFPSPYFAHEDEDEDEDGEKGPE